MNRITAVSAGTRLSVAGLVLAAIGMLLEMAAGSGLYPTLTGPVVLLVVAAVVAIRTSRWTAFLGLITSAVLAVGLAASALLSPTFLEQLVDLGNAGMIAGSLLHVVGLIAAVAGGVRMVWRPNSTVAAA